MKESDLYEPVVELFHGGNVYPEVVVGRKRPDIVVKQGSDIVVIELKTSLSLALIEQAYHWVGKCDLVYVAIPAPRRFNKFAVRLLTDKGIGVIVVQGSKAYVHRTATKQTNKIIKWERYLHEFYKQNESGGTNGEYITPYKFMIQCIREYMQGLDNEITLQELIKQVDERYDQVISKHYGSPESSLRKALTEYEREWCDRTKLRGRVYFSLKK